MEIPRYLPLFVLFLVTCASAEKPDKPSVDLSTNVTDTDEGYSSGSSMDWENDHNDDDDDLSESEKKRILELMSHKEDPGRQKRIEKEAIGDGEKTNAKRLDYGQLHEAIISEVRKKLRIFESDKLARDVDEELTGLSGKWSELRDDQKSKLQTTLSVVATNIESFANAKDDPVGAIKGAMEIIASISVGQFTGKGLWFVSFLLALFGKGPKQVPLSAVVEREVEKVMAKYGDQTLKSQAADAIKSLSEIKDYLDGQARLRKKILHMGPRARTTMGSVFAGALHDFAKGMFVKDSIYDRDKCLAYTEIYARITALREIIIIQSIVLSNDPDDIKGLIRIRDTMRRSAKHLFEYLYVIDKDKASYGKKILMYFDPDDSPVTDAYATSILGLGKFDRSLADGLYCLVYHNDKDLVWDTTYPELKINKAGDPYTALKNHSNENCYWKLVPHGYNAYTIKNRKCDTP